MFVKFFYRAEILSIEPMSSHAAVAVYSLWVVQTRLTPIRRPRYNAAENKAEISVSLHAALELTRTSRPGQTPSADPKFRQEYRHSAILSEYFVQIR